MSIQTLQWFRCTDCQSDFSRPTVRGVHPKRCPKCRGIEGGSPEVKPRPAVKAEDKAEDKAERVLPMPKGEHTHHMFSWLISAILSNVHVYLHGPAGSGKSTAARQAGRALNRAVYTFSCNPMMSGSDLIGYNTVDGSHSPGMLREAFETGGIVLLDELDASNPEVLTVLNAIAALNADEEYTFPDATVKRHATFSIIAGGNTDGQGGAEDEGYVRQILDVASLDRFGFVAWGYDVALERKIAPNKEWCEYVLKVRRAVEKAKVRNVMITPRATIAGGRMLNDGAPRSMVESMVLWKAIPADTKASVLAHM